MTAPDSWQPPGTVIASWPGNWIAGDGFAAPAHLLGHVGPVAGRLFVHEHGVAFASARDAAFMTRLQERFDRALPDCGRGRDQLAQLMQRYRDRYASAPPS